MHAAASWPRNQPLQQETKMAKKSKASLRKPAAAHIKKSRHKSARLACRGHKPMPIKERACAQSSAQYKYARAREISMVSSRWRGNGSMKASVSRWAWPESSLLAAAC